jgi:hypothetical protein
MMCGGRVEDKEMVGDRVKDGHESSRLSIAGAGVLRDLGFVPKVRKLVEASRFGMVLDKRVVLTVSTQRNNLRRKLGRSGDHKS